MRVTLPEGAGMGWTIVMVVFLRQEKGECGRRLIIGADRKMDVMVRVALDLKGLLRMTLHLCLWWVVCVCVFEECECRDV